MFSSDFKTFWNLVLNMIVCGCNSVSLQHRSTKMNGSGRATNQHNTKRRRMSPLRISKQYLMDHQ
jgi:hypothetical protein